MSNRSVDPIDSLSGSGTKGYSDMNMAEKIEFLKAQKAEMEAQANWMAIHNKNAAADANNIQQDKTILDKAASQKELRPTEKLELGAAGQTNKALPFKAVLSFDQMQASATGTTSAATTTPQAAAVRPQPFQPATPQPQPSNQSDTEKQQAQAVYTPDTAQQTAQATQLQTSGEAISSEGSAEDATGQAQLGGQIDVGGKKAQGVSSHTTNTATQDMTINMADALNVGAEATVTANTASDGRNDGETGGDSGRQHR